MLEVHNFLFQPELVFHPQPGKESEEVDDWGRGGGSSDMEKNYGRVLYVNAWRAIRKYK